MALFIAGCSLYPALEGSGFPKTTTYKLSSFTKIQAGDAFKVHVVPDPQFSVQVTCDDNIVRYLNVYQKSGVLHLDLKEGYTFMRIILSAEVHLPTMGGLDISGASMAKLDAGFSSSQPLDILVSGASSVESQGITAGAVTAEVSGASELSIMGIQATTLDAAVSGASSLLMKGAAGGEKLSASGASRADLIDCLAPHADVDLSGASKAYINVGNGSILLTASGASTLYFKGNPTFSFNELSGASEIKKVN
jgi:hypothetical protein